MTFSLKSIIQLTAVPLLLLLTSCGMFSSREIDVSPAGSQEIIDYFKNDLVNPEGLRFESSNFLQGNLLERDFRKTPQKILTHINAYYEISRDPKYYAIAADLCHYLARKAGPDKAISYHLSALYYSRLAAITQRENQKKPGSGSQLVMFQLLQIYNEACSGVFYYLKEHDLLNHDSFHLSDMEGRRFHFKKPVYRLSLPLSSIAEVNMCPAYTVHRLMQINRQAGFGVPLVAKVKPQSLFKSLRTPPGLTIPVTMLLTCQPGKNDSMEITLLYQDTSMQETLKLNNSVLSSEFPLALDFSTPLACLWAGMPEKNVISVMIDPYGEETQTGLYMLEPYNPDKIPVVFVHGLMSSPETWIQMINSLKNDPVIRRRYQFWFYSYSSGAPIIYSAGKLHRDLLAAQAELCATQEAAANFNRMLLVGHSMGGLISRALLQQDPWHFIEYTTKMSRQEIQSRLTPNEFGFLKKFTVFPPLPFVHRVVFMAVPHRGSEMAHMPIAHFGSWITKLPHNLLVHTDEFTSVTRRLGMEKAVSRKLKNQFFTGIDNLAPDSFFIQAISASPLKKDLIYHSVIGNKAGDDIPGGSDGVVPYSSSHIDGAASELIVQSGHSVHRRPRAMRELLRIMRMHLDELEQPSGKQ